MTNNDFGPRLGQEFDFTALFEGSILSILPSAVFLVATAARLVFVAKKKRNGHLRASKTLWTKLVCLFKLKYQVLKYLGT